MNPPRFFCRMPLSKGLRADLPEGVARHVSKVLRLRENDLVTLFDGSGGEYVARIVASGRSAVSVEVLEWHALERESPLVITLVQALQAGEKMDLTVQKAVELGVSSIVPVVSRRGVVRLEGERAVRRVEHWRAVAASACEQCGRNRVPGVAALTGLERWLAQASQPNVRRLMLAPGAPDTLATLTAPLAGERIELLIGAEGGLAPEEMQAAGQAGFLTVRLGPRVLRTETAGLAALAAMQCLWGDFRERDSHV